MLQKKETVDLEVQINGSDNENELQRKRNSYYPYWTGSATKEYQETCYSFSCYYHPPE